MAALKGDNMRIPQFYAGRSVLITGATGFMGKVLVERLLTTCPDIGRLYLLMRTKRDADPNQRLQQLKDSAVFNNLRQRDPEQLNKLRTLPGDILQPKLGISKESIAELKEVSIVFHSAATVKFNEELRRAIEYNVLSVMRLLKICDELPNMQAFVHVSTAYSNADRKEIEEKVYPITTPLDELLALLDDENIEPEELNKYLGSKPNTYTFTKGVAEYVVQQHPKKRYSAAIFRPSVVISSNRNPFPGWIENMNGPSGVIAGYNAGLLRVFTTNSAKEADLLPVDIAIDNLIAVAWETALSKSTAIKVYNCSVCENPTTWGDIERNVISYTREHPPKKTYFYPFLLVVKNRFLYAFLEFMLQAVPFHIIEFVSRIFGIKQKHNLLALNQKFRDMTAALRFFVMNEWTFKNDNMRMLREKLHPSDAKLFHLDPRTVNWKEHYSNFVIGVRRHLLKHEEEDTQTKEQFRRAAMF
ncbi:fatty acyl-CoA reductase 1-like [Achroia grisella]|uniref:fatty acyl-CoA reductase 1-like n=1 Tax=Achroia grisella TaxID=688607 RepID=UPI0027D318B5|nr:fatty acyl-CoA reductase 1-like [Achroia grisella]